MRYNKQSDRIPHRAHVYLYTLTVATLLREKEKKEKEIVDDLRDVAHGGGERDETNRMQNNHTLGKRYRNKIKIKTPHSSGCVNIERCSKSLPHKIKRTHTQAHANICL